MNSQALTAIPLATPNIPDVLLRSLRRSVLKTMAKLQSGQLEVHEPDGSHQRLGKPGTPLLRVNIYDLNFYAYIAFGGSTGAGQAWILGLWDTQDLMEVTRLFVRERDTLAAMDNGFFASLRSPVYKAMEWRRRNTPDGSGRNIRAHYDLGNDFFKLFLDDSMTYSAAVFADAATPLAQAQRDKYDLICRKLDLKAGESLLEIGSGWGGMAMHAARHYGVQVTTTTLSDEQFELATERVKLAGLERQITVLKQDYRALSGRYDKIVSIEMIEAVGHAFLPVYFKKLQQLLTANGQVLIQAITIQDQYYDQLRKGTDFIREHVFPGGHLPCNREMLRVSAQHTSLRLFDLEDFGQDYARTLKHWRHAFHQHLGQIKALGYSQEFCRLWDFYLASCEAGFRESTTSVVHAHFTMPGCHRERLGFVEPSSTSA